MIRLDDKTSLKDDQLQRNLAHTLGKTLAARDRAVEEVENWEELRAWARQLKLHTLANLSAYLERLERRIESQGGRVIWAETAGQAVDFVLELAHHREIRRAIKGKSMMSEEIELNRALERARVEVVETDLGEYIVQLAGESPSHLIAPALHKSRRQIRDLFVDKLDMPHTDDVNQITEAARRVMRRHFLSARLGITGVNFAVAESGTLAIVENEGNVRLSLSTPAVHVALMGLEKVIPRDGDLAVFLKLLTRSATGQAITSYVNLVRGPRARGELDGPEEFYLVLIDNGRSRILQDALLRQTLACIRCGACQNVCPVYQRLGGHAYGSTYQGPIGAILTPQLEGADAPRHAFASSLCAACRDVCPVKIEIPRILLRLRERVQKGRSSRAGCLPFEKWGMQIWARVMQSPLLYGRLSYWIRRLGGLPGLASRIPPLSHWSGRREVPQLARLTFRQMWLEQERRR